MWEWAGKRKEQREGGEGGKEGREGGEGRRGGKEGRKGRKRRGGRGGEGREGREGGKEGREKQVRCTYVPTDKFVVCMYIIDDTANYVCVYIYVVVQQTTGHGSNTLPALICSRFTHTRMHINNSCSFEVPVSPSTHMYTAYPITRYGTSKRQIHASMAAHRIVRETHITTLTGNDFPVSVLGDIGLPCSLCGCEVLKRQCL